MKKTMIPAEVIAHFDTKGIITPYRIKYEKEGIQIMQISRILKRGVNTFGGNTVEVYDCVAMKEDCEICFALNFEKKLSRWFLTKI
ncbi:MAG: hypothetical protein JXN65_05240 [Clostridia bacterium]|nr:hypothetical protein [Clostridia bacterium]